MKKANKKKLYTSEIPYNAYAYGGLTDQFPELLLQKNNTIFPSNPGKPSNLGQYFSNGGWMQNMGDFGANMLKADANILGSTIGYRPFDPNQMSGEGTNFAQGASQFGSNLVGQAAPMALGMINPMAGMALKGVQQGVKQSQVDQYPLGGEMMTYGKGGRFMGINPAHKGYCTPMTKSTCTPHRKALAKTLKKHHGFHAEGGIQPSQNNQEFYNNWSKDNFLNLAAPIVYPMGGVHPSMANAQIEKQEVVNYPDGGTDQADAPTHANGGLDVNLPGQTHIFSDRLKALTGKTFAKEAEKFKNNKWDKILDDENNHDPLRIKTANMMKEKNQKNLDAIFAEQESQKQMKAGKAFNKFMAKHGGTMPMFCYGGNMNYPYGGIGPDKPNYYNGPNSLMWDNTNDQGQQIYNVNNTPQQNQMQFNATNYGGELNTNSNPSFNNIGQPQDISFNNKLAGTKWAQTNPEFEQKPGRFLNPENSNNTQGQPFDKNAAINAGIGTALSNIGPMSYLLSKDKNPTKQSFYKFNPGYLDPTASLNEVDRSSYGVQKTLPGVSGGNAGATMNSLLENGINRDQTKRGIQSQYDNANTQIKNSAQQYNIAGQYAVDDTNMRRSDQSLNRKYQALYNTGENLAGGNRTYNEYRGDNQDRNMMKDYAPDFYFDERGVKRFRKQNS